MATLENVEKLREKIDCTYEEASSALDECNDDLLDAIIYLEKKGKTSQTSGGSYSTKDGAYSEQHHYESTGHTTHTTRSGANGFFAWLGKIIRMGNANYFDVINNGNTVLSLPVTAFVLLLIFLFPFMVCVLIFGLFCRLSYRFRGAEFDRTRANEYSQRASQAAEKIKQDVQNGMADDDASADNNEQKE